MGAGRKVLKRFWGVCGGVGGDFSVGGSCVFFLKGGRRGGGGL